MSSTVRVAAPSPLQRALLYASAALVSVLSHGGLLAGYLLWAELNVELDSAGEGTDNDGPIGNGGGDAAPADTEPPADLALKSVAAPVQVSLYVPPTAAPPTTTPTAPAGEAAVPRPKAKPHNGPSSVEPAAGQATSSTDDGGGKASHDGVAGKGPKGAKKPCEPNDDIVQLSDTKWRVPRDLVDWYVAHLRELEKHVGVAVHTGADGKKDGAKLYVPRCSVLRQGGIKSGDIVHTVNGQPVTNIPQAFAVYMKVRRQDTIKVELTRKDGSKRTHIYKFK